jgi:hypothetical protein
MKGTRQESSARIAQEGRKRAVEPSVFEGGKTAAMSLN